MLSLRSFHLLFMVIVIVAADMFGAWGVWMYANTGDVWTLSAGILSFAAGFALIFYAIWFVRKMDRAHVA